MKRTDIINLLIDKYDYKNYLEIGVQHADSNFNKIKVENKVGVDPDENSDAEIKLTSDAFFKENKEKFDIIFIDGLHHAKNVCKDILNSLECLNEGGTIVCHDMNPHCEEIQIVPRETKEWTGDGWKAFVKLNQERDDLDMYVVDTDYGCGIIRKLDNYKYEKTRLNFSRYKYGGLVKNRKEWLNLIKVDEFRERLGFVGGRIWEFLPYDINKNYGVSCNEYCELVKDSEDWIVVWDHDVMRLAPFHKDILLRAINKYPDAGIFTCYTNRTKQTKQIYNTDLFNEPNMGVHAGIAFFLAEEPFSVKEITLTISGHMMMFKKSTWDLVGGFKETGVLGIDTNFSRRVLAKGLKIYLIENIYVLHYYRYLRGVNYRSHLK